MDNPAIDLTRGRRERRRERTRRTLLDCALVLFAERGLYSTRLEDITERADLGKGAFYNYFDSKDSLVAELLSEAVDLLDRLYLSPVARTGPLGERITELVSRHDAFFTEHPPYVLLFHQARGLLKLGADPGGRLAFVFRDYLSRLGRLIPEAANGMAWSEDDRRHIAALVAGAVAGYRSFESITGLAPDPALLARALGEGLQALADRRSGAASGRAAPAAHGHGGHAARPPRPEP